MVQDNRKIRVLVADDHPLIRGGLQTCLAESSEVEWIGEACDGESVLAEARRLCPDVVLMDFAMPKLDGLRATAALHREQPTVGIIALSAHEERHHVLQMVHAGARGYLTKDAFASELVAAVLVVGRGGTYFSARAARALSTTRSDESAILDTTGAELSPREREVLVKIADGKGNKQIAEELQVSVRTVESHRERLMRKLQIHTVAGLTKYAVSRGYVSPA